MTKEQLELREKIKPKRGKYQMCDPSIQLPVTDERWNQFDESFNKWFDKYKDNLTSMEAGMSQPNPPNYFRANND